MLDGDDGAHLNPYAPVAGRNLGSIEIDTKRTLHGGKLDRSRITQNGTVVPNQKNAARVGWDGAQGCKAYVDGLPGSESNGWEFVAGVVEAAL